MRKSVIIGILLLLLLTACGSVVAEENNRIGEEKIINPLGATRSPGIVTTDMVSAQDLVDTLLGGGVTVSNVNYVGTGSSAGTFNGASGIIGFSDGVILSSGDISNVIGPNTVDSVTANNNLAGDADLDGLLPAHSTMDATVLEFDFVPIDDVITFKYVFSSDEYNEYVNSPFNDIFAFFLNGNNIACIPGTSVPVAINNVHNGNPFGVTAGSYSIYYRNNDLDDGGPTIDTEMDGLTTVFTATAAVNPGEINHIKLAIADTSDHVLDSNVFIKAESFISPGLTLEPLDATNYLGTSHELTATLHDGTGVPIAGELITFNIVEGPNTGMSGSATTASDGTATWSYTSTVEGTDKIVASGYNMDSNDAYKTWVRGTQAPEFPSIVIPGVLIVGLFGIVLFMRRD